MIIGNIKDAKRYYSVNENFAATFEFLSSLDKDSVGVFEFDGFKANVFEQSGADLEKDGSARAFEAHRKYLDIHYVISGKEGMGYSDIDKLTALAEYNEEGDYILLSGELNKIVMNEGDFCIVFPEDAHIPAMSAGDTPFKKAVVKIKI